VAPHPDELTREIRATRARIDGALDDLTEAVQAAAGDLRRRAATELTQHVKEAARRRGGQ